MGQLSFKRCRGIAFRATTYDTPLWVSPNTRPGRWSRPEDGTIAQYCSLDVASAVAEMVRSESLREIEQAREMRVDIWELRVDEGAIVDYSTADRADRQGFSWAPLVDDDWEDCVQEGLRIQGEGGRGVIAPSAALPGSLALNLFGPRTEIAWEAESRLSIQIPARQILRSAPGNDLVGDTRFFGDPFPKIAAAAADRLFNVDLAPSKAPRRA